MAQKVEVLLIDDLDGSTAEETVVFGLDGKQYEIDLSDGHAKQLREELARFVSAARKTGGGRRPARSGGRGSRRSNSDDEPSSREVREWAKAHGIEINERGRIPAEVMGKFKEAQGA